MSRPPRPDDLARLRPHPFADIVARDDEVLPVLADAPPTRWMATLRDAIPLSALSIPGTHNSPTYHVALPSVRCQAVDVRAQLDNGVRFLDVRLALKVEQGEERLLAFHGPTEQFRELGEVLTELYAWLDGPGKRGEHPHAPIAPSC